MYAELARIAESWDPIKIERAIFGRHRGGQDFLQSRRSFFSVRDGGRLQRSHAERVQERFPRSGVMLCWRHPLAQILCDAELMQDGVLAELETLPRGRARACVWDEQGISWLAGYPVRREVPATTDLIERLMQENHPKTLLTLAGRMRLEQLRGTGKHDHHYVRAIWSCLPVCVARSPHLYLGQNALIQALDRFMAWLPFADHRELRMAASLEIIDLRNSVFDRLEVAAVRWKRKRTFPPFEELERRRLQLVDILSFDSANR